MKLKPEKVYKDRELELAVWANKKIKNNKELVFHNVTIKRYYKNENNEWNASVNFDTESLLRIAKLLTAAYEDFHIKVKDFSSKQNEGYSGDESDVEVMVDGSLY